MQHLSIRKEGVEGIKKNQFEQKYKQQFLEMQQSRKSEQASQNFELTNKHIHYR